MTRAREIANVLGRNIESTTFTATAGQTAFSITHATGRIQVYMNGLLLDPTVDWTSDGSTVTLTEGAVAGDELEVVEHDTLSVADAMPVTGGNMSGVLGMYTASTDPVGTQGQIYFNTDKKALRVHDGTRWMSVRENIYPTQFNDLDAWWDFSGTYSTISAGNASVTDATGNGHTLTEVGTCPTKAFPNGRNGIRIGNGSTTTHHYTTSNYIPVTGSGARTLFAVFCEQLDNSGLQHIMHYGTNATNQAFGIAWHSNAYQQHLWGGSGATLSTYNLGVMGADGVRVVFSHYDGATGTIRVYDSSSEEGVSSSGNSYTPSTGSTYPMAIGLRVSGAEGGDFVIGECGVYTRALSTYEMDKIAQGLLDRWGNG